jgi:tRNA pseudouridine55 synthase
MDGIIIVDKPAGWTSHDVVARVRRILREKRVGHTGTLDPFATGVLVLLIGRATRLAQFLAGAEKEYEATLRLGYATTTGDLTGARREMERSENEQLESERRENERHENETASSSSVSCATLGRGQIEAAFASLRGEIEQVPPMYSAKKVGGKKLYELARRGEEIERKAVRVRVNEFEIVAEKDGEFLRRNEDGTCDVRARVVCSAGTYVRALAESVGERLGTGAHLASLRRTRAGEFRVEDSFAPDELQRFVESGVGFVESGAGVRKFLLSMESALPHLPSAHLTGEEARKVRHGQAVRVAEIPRGLEDGGHVLLFDEEGFLVAVGAYDAARQTFQPRVMLAVEK